MKKQQNNQKAKKNTTTQTDIKTKGHKTERAKDQRNKRQNTKRPKDQKTKPKRPNRYNITIGIQLNFINTYGISQNFGPAECAKRLSKTPYTRNKYICIL